MPLGTCQQWLHLLALDGFQVRTIEQTVSLLLPATSTVLMQAHAPLFHVPPSFGLTLAFKGEAASSSKFLFWRHRQYLCTWQ